MKDNLIQPVVNMSPFRVANKVYIHLPLTEHFFFFFLILCFSLSHFRSVLGGCGQLEIRAGSREEEGAQDLRADCLLGGQRAHYHY